MILRAISVWHPMASIVTKQPDNSRLSSSLLSLLRRYRFQARIPSKLERNLMRLASLLKTYNALKRYLGCSNGDPRRPSGGNLFMPPVCSSRAIKTVRMPQRWWKAVRQAFTLSESTGKFLRKNIRGSVCSLQGEVKCETGRKRTRA